MLLGSLFCFFSSRRRHTRFDCDWSSDVCSSDLCAPSPTYRILTVWHPDRKHRLAGLRQVFFGLRSERTDDPRSRGRRPPQRQHGAPGIGPARERHAPGRTVGTDAEIRQHAPAPSRHGGEPLMYTAKGQLDRSALIKQYQPLVRRLAHHMMAKLPPSVEVDDLIQVGLIGLSDALTRYEASQGVQFETFATQRIRGAMLDELRENDWMSRGSRKSQKEIEVALRRLEHKLGRSPAESEIAAELGMSLADYQSLLGKVRGTQLVYLEDMAGGGDDQDSFLDRHVADSDADPLN